MTPKEKAEELIYQFAQRIPPSSYEVYENGVQINFDLVNSSALSKSLLNISFRES